MTDAAAVALGLCAAIGAWLGQGPPVAVGVAGCIAALLIRHPWVLCLAVLALTGGRAAADARGLESTPTGPFRGWVELTSDPIERPGGSVRVDARAGDELLALSARGPAAIALRGRAAGDAVEVAGARHRATTVAAPWLERRHIAVQMTVAEVGAWRDGRWLWRIANAARDSLERSSFALPERQRGLYLGLVLGDDRAEPADIADDFRGAGLSHLLAVSGENVAFVLALAAPLMRRSSLRVRLVLVITVLGVFVVATRGEPSVLRAAAMAAIAAIASALGREASGIRLLSLAVAGLLVADPFLARSLGFQLSVAASAAILVLARPLARRLPGPGAVADVVSVSIAAQIGVAPVLATTVGGPPVAGLLANVLAAPAAAAVMAWGMVAGLAGGVLGPTAASFLHAPTRVLVWWLMAVASWSADLPLGRLDWRELIALALAASIAALGRRFRSRSLAIAVAATIAVVALLGPVLPLGLVVDGGIAE